MNMVCPPTITAPTGSWARRREKSRADVRPTHRATVRSDERARPPRRDGRARAQLDRNGSSCARQTRLHEIFSFRKSSYTREWAPRAFATFRLATIYLPQCLLLKWVVVNYTSVLLLFYLFYYFIFV
jgi:hypothetical protein